MTLNVDDLDVVVNDVLDHLLGREGKILSFGSQVRAEREGARLDVEDELGGEDRLRQFGLLQLREVEFQLLGHEIVADEMLIEMANDRRGVVLRVLVKEVGEIVEPETGDGDEGIVVVARRADLLEHAVDLIHARRNDERGFDVVVDAVVVEDQQLVERGQRAKQGEIVGLVEPVARIFAEQFPCPGLQRGERAVELRDERAGELEVLLLENVDDVAEADGEGRRQGQNGDQLVKIVVGHAHAVGYVAHGRTGVCAQMCFSLDDRTGNDDIAGFSFLRSHARPVMPGEPINGVTARRIALCTRSLSLSSAFSPPDRGEKNVDGHFPPLLYYVYMRENVKS